MDLMEWAEAHEPRDGLWKADREKQVQRFRDLAEMMGVKAAVVGAHTSKSVMLPVVEIPGTHGRFRVRDNFHDVNVAVLWDFPLYIPMSTVYSVVTWEEYLEAMQRKAAYDHWDQWTDEELNDPRILRVEVVNHNGTSYWQERGWEEKKRWLNRMTDPQWFVRDWRNGHIFVEGGLQNMREGCTFYWGARPFAEGLLETLQPHEQQPYEPGRSAFLVNAGTFERLVELMQAVNAAAPQ